MNISMAVDYATKLDADINAFEVEIDKHKTKIVQILQGTDSNNYAGLISDKKEIISDLKSKIATTKARIDFLVKEFEIKRCTYCNEWTDEKLKDSVFHPHKGLFCSKRCEKYMDEDCA